MSVALKQGMTVDEFMAWYETVPGRYEFHFGEVYAMSPERTGHAKTKFKVQKELDRAIAAAALPCHMLPDGITVRCESDSYEPDALVYCGPQVPDDETAVTNPIIIVEVLSPSTGRVDKTAKLAGYFGLPSVQHYIIVDQQPRPTILHSRQRDGSILTKLVRSGHLQLDPPGLLLNFDAFFT
jgi:Uma2 family endonuclease